jgi:hypothetical protein
MPVDLLTADEQRAPETPARRTLFATEDEDLEAVRRRRRRVHRLKLHVAAYALGAFLLTSLWVANEWQANGALERFGHEGEPGQWNPTLWALAVGIWGLVVGIMALRTYFRRPPPANELARELERPAARTTSEPAAALRRTAQTRLERVRRLRFHVAAWVLGMVVLTPLWALLEWQDNGGFQRFGIDSRPGEWEPWILYVGGVWALAVAIFALSVYLDRPRSRAGTGGDVNRSPSEV